MMFSYLDVNIFTNMSLVIAEQVKTRPRVEENIL